MKVFAIVLTVLVATVAASDDAADNTPRSASYAAAAPAPSYGGSSSYSAPAAAPAASYGHASSYGGASASYGGSYSIPSPPCPKNYMFSCQPSLTPVPCAASAGYGSAAYAAAPAAYAAAPAAPASYGSAGAYSHYVPTIAIV